MECRVCAEDPDHQFFPSAGRIGQLREPSGPGVRLDSGVYPGWTVPLEYDPLLAKLVTWGPDRNAAVQRLQRALSEYAISGIQTNIAFFREILADPEFLAGNLSTEFVADFLARRRPVPEQRTDPAPPLDTAVALAALAHFQNGHERATADSKLDASRWLTEGRGQLLR
jgi:acetyl-CoA carboxylase, biotin carboxylase subunit